MGSLGTNSPGNCRRRSGPRGAIICEAEPAGELPTGRRCHLKINIFVFINTPINNILRTGSIALGPSPALFFYPDREKAATKITIRVRLIASLRPVGFSFCFPAGHFLNITGDGPNAGT